MTNNELPLDLTMTEVEQSPLPLDSNRQYTPVQLFFLRRLERLTELSQREQIEEGWQAKLLAKALYSTYFECRVLNVDAEARTLLNRQAPHVAEAAE